MEELCSCDSSEPVKVEVVNQENLTNHVIKMAVGTVVVITVQQIVPKLISKVSDFNVKRKEKKQAKAQQNPK